MTHTTARTGLIVIFLCVAVFLAVFILLNGNRLDDLEERVTTFETIRIELVAPPEGGER